MGISRQNLVSIPKVTVIKSNLKRLRYGSINTQLVNRKSLLIMDYTLQNNLDLVFIQKTRIKEGMTEYETSLINLNSHSYKFQNLQRDTRGGCLEELYGESLKSGITEVTNVSFPEIIVHLSIPGTIEIMAIAGIYHLPRSGNTPNDSTFITEFSLYLEIISQFKRWIISMFESL